MKFSVNKAILADAMSTVQKALPSRSTNPLLEGVLINASENLNLTCSDGSIQIETVINAQDAQIDETGSIVLPGKLFSEIIRKFNDDLITVDIQETEDKVNAKISSGSSKTTIQCWHADEYPLMPVIEEDESLLINQATIKEMIKQTVFACAQDELRPILTGVLFSLKNNCLSLVALDGYRLAIRTEPVNKDITYNAIIPSSSLNEIAKTLNEDDTDVNICFSKNSAAFKLTNTKVTTVLLNGEFSRYDQIIPSEHTTYLEINRKEFQNALELASLMAQDIRENLICLNLRYDMIIVTSNSEIGNVYKTLDSKVTGNELEIAFNGKYLLDVLSKLDDENIIMRFNSNISPCTIESIGSNKYLYLILPVRAFN